jgi:hypothetical protein
MIEMWHGGRRWTGGPELQAPKAGRYECGPGIYLTNRYLRAVEYAKGGGVTTLVTLRDRLRWLEKSELPLATLQDYVRCARGFRKREAVLDDLERSAARLKRDILPVTYLVNLCTYYEVLNGGQGVRLAQWLSEQGIDASLHSVNGEEQWVIVFNPSAITHYRARPASQVSLEQYELPRIDIA